MSTSIKIEIASPPDRERLVVNLMVGNEQLAEVNQESGELLLEIYARQDGKPWILSCAEMNSALNEAKKALLSR